MFKEKLMEALKTAVSYYNSTNDPNLAIIKTAEKFDFNADQTQRLIEMFNTAHSIHHYKTAVDKTSPFKLASSAQILKSLFDTTAKLAFDMMDNLMFDVYDEYDIPEIGVVISVPFEEVKTANYNDMDLNKIMMKGTDRVEALNKVIENCKTAENIIIDEYSNIVYNLAKKLTFTEPNKAGNILSNLAKYAAINYGQKGVDFVISIAELTPDYDINIKTGAIDDGEINEYINELDYAMSCVDQLNDIINKRAECENWRNELIDELYKPFERDKCIPLYFNKALDLFEEKVSSDNNSSNKNISDFSIIDLIYGPSFNVDKAREYVVDTLNKDRLEKIKEINDDLKLQNDNLLRQEILLDLMYNDPVLSTEDPKRLSKLYESIMEISPEVSTKKEVVRSILRAMTQTTSIDAYDANTWLNMEKIINQIRSGKFSDSGDQTGAQGKK